MFWGLVSLFFAAAACYYYLENYKNERTADSFREQVQTLQDERDSLNSEKGKLQASVGETETELKTREDFLTDKETKLAAEEAHLDTLNQQLQNQTQQIQGQAGVLKKFNDAIHKLGPGIGSDVVERDGRPVLRIPNVTLFDPGDSALKPEGKAALTQIAQALNGQLDNFEFRVVSYTDSTAESDKKKTAADAAAAGWELTSERAVALARFFRDDTRLPFQNVLVLARGDSEPIDDSAKESRAHNRRVEISITPLPPPFHAASDTDVSDNSPPDSPSKKEKKP
jgi:chemotaxis protein MotB